MNRKADTKTVDVTRDDVLLIGKDDAFISVLLTGHDAKPSRAEWRSLRHRKTIPISQWAERHRVVRVSSRPGEWRNKTTPYLAGIMDAVGLPFVNDVTVVAVPQSGKTDCAYNCLASWVDQAPGPAMIVFADEQTAKDELTERIEPMIQDSKRLQKYRTDKLKDVTGAKLVLKNMIVHMAWATSVARLATKPKRYVLFDECDKYPDQQKKETNSISLGTKRARTYGDDKKIFKYSSPTIEAGPIWLSYLAAQIRFDYRVKCPDCGKFQLMHFGGKKEKGGIKWPADQRDPAEIETEKMAWYQCEHCKSKWDDDRRDLAVLAGGWFCCESSKPIKKILAAKRPARIAFLIPAWISTFVSISECAAAFLRGSKSQDAYRDFCNAYEARPWQAYSVDRVEDVIVALRDDRKELTVPSDDKIYCLTGAVDTQDDGFWYEVRAWGKGFALESWQVRAGFLPVLWKSMHRLAADRQWPYHPAFDAIRHVMFETKYLDAVGNEYPVHLTTIDAMGHYTSEVYDFCRAHKGKIYPLQGMRNRSNRPYKYTKIETYPGKKRRMAGGLMLLQVDVNHYKDEFSTKLQISGIDPGAWHLNSDTTREWCRHLCAEYLDEKTNRWECPPKKANHGWDCGVYGLALADVLQIKARSQAPEPAEKKQEKKKRVNPFTDGQNYYK